MDRAGRPLLSYGAPDLSHSGVMAILDGRAVFGFHGGLPEGGDFLAGQSRLSRSSTNRMFEAVRAFAGGRGVKIQCSVVEGPRRGESFEFESHDMLLIGRNCNRGLDLNGDSAISRNHCLIEFAPPLCHLKDLGSSNGTYVNGERVKQVELHSGDRIGVGDTVLKIEIPQPSQPTTWTRDLGAPEPAYVPCCVRCGREPDSPDAFAVDHETSTGEVICSGCREKVLVGEDLFDGHKVLGKLGQGGMGTVYKARNLATGEVVAVKTLKPEHAQSDRAIAMFLRESQLGSQLDHPHITKVYGSRYSHGVFYFLMEFVDGSDAQQYMQREGRPFTVEEAVPVTLQVLDALEHAHGKGMMHRDVKPSNMMLARILPDPLAKLTDFGLMRTARRSGYSFITRSDEVKGSLPFMAPEQILDPMAAGSEVDIYSLGASLYYMLTTRPPLAFGRGDNMIKVILEQLPQPARELNPTIPEALESFLQKALAKTFDQRHGSSEEFRDALLAATVS